MRTWRRRLLAVALAAVAVLVTTGCANRDRLDAEHDARVSAARAVAAEAFPESLDALKKRPGVTVADLDRGAGLHPVPQRAFVRVTGPAAVGDLDFDDMLDRLERHNWSLLSGTDSASACTAGPQSLPCHFGNDRDDASISITPLPGGGYELTATPASRPPAS